MNPSPDTSKYSHLAEEEMQVAALKTELPFGETFTSEGILFYPSICLFFCFLDTVLTLFSQHLQGLLLPLKVTPP